jgi:Secretion system C-terminal sorting domain
LLKINSIMKNIVSLTGLLFTTTLCWAQITIDNNDMPSVGDTFRVSNGLISPTIDPVPTGAAFTWDFSMLQPVSQDVDTFIDVASTGTFYSVVFSNLPFNPYRANLAAQGPTFPTVPQISVSDVYYFYYNSSSSYSQSGYGASLNGFPTPIPFNARDRVYAFPLNFGNLDSSDSDFNISIPGLGSYTHDQHRVNETDGWGTLITPFGSFNTLRVRSEITSRDSLYLDTLGIGFGFQNPLSIEYKWLADQGGIPILQINTSVSFGTEIITSIRYRDSVRTLTGLNEVIEVATIGLNIFPNPASDQIGVDLYAASDDEIVLQLVSLQGQHLGKLFEGKVKAGVNRMLFDISKMDLSAGVYLLEATGKSGSGSTRLLIDK